MFLHVSEYFPFRRRYYDPSVLSYQSDRMPEQIKLKVGGVDSSQFAVYEEFARNIPGFQAMSERDAFIPKANLPVSAARIVHPNE